MKPIPLFDMAAHNGPLKEALARAAAKAIRSGRYVLGPEGEAFEKEFAAAHGAKHGIGVASGTAALQLPLSALGIGPESEVLTTPFTFIATANAISHLGARPVFADISEDTLTLDPVEAAKKVTSRTQALVPVHLFGVAADMDPLMALAKEKGLKVVEDACQAHLAEYKGRKVGSFGDAAAFSFYPTKNLGALGDAGMITLQDAALDGSIRILRNNGSSVNDKYLHPMLGHNARLDEVQAAMLRVKFKKLKAWTEARRKRAKLYAQELKGLPLVLPAEPEGFKHVYHLYVVRTPKRDALSAHLKAKGIASGVYYPVPLHLQPAYRHLGYKAGDFPKAEQAAKEVLALPLSQDLTEAQVRYVCAQVRAFFTGE